MHKQNDKQNETKVKTLWPKTEMISPERETSQDRLSSSATGGTTTLTKAKGREHVKQDVSFSEIFWQIK